MNKILSAIIVAATIVGCNTLPALAVTNRNPGPYYVMDVHRGAITNAHLMQATTGQFDVLYGDFEFRNVRVATVSGETGDIRTLYGVYSFVTNSILVEPVDTASNFPPMAGLTILTGIYTRVETNYVDPFKQVSVTNEMFMSAVGKVYYTTGSWYISELGAAFTNRGHYRITNSVTSLGGEYLGTNSVYTNFAKITVYGVTTTKLTYVEYISAQGSNVFNRANFDAYMKKSGDVASGTIAVTNDVANHGYINPQIGVAAYSNSAVFAVSLLCQPYPNEFIDGMLLSRSKVGVGIVGNYSIGIGYHSGLNGLYDPSSTNVDFFELGVWNENKYMWQPWACGFPSNSYHAATKGYTDNTFAKKCGDTICGSLIFTNGSRNFCDGYVVNNYINERGVYLGYGSNNVGILVVTPDLVDTKTPYLGTSTLSFADAYFGGLVRLTVNRPVCDTENSLVFKGYVDSRTNIFGLTHVPSGAWPGQTWYSNGAGTKATYIWSGTWQQVQ